MIVSYISLSHSLHATIIRFLHPCTRYKYAPFSISEDSKIAFHDTFSLQKFDNCLFKLFLYF